jgi:hypothetical protein
VAKHPNDFHLAALPVISVAVTAGYLSLVGEVQHCVQFVTLVRARSYSWRR